MKRIAALLVCSAACVWSQALDLSSLDKLKAKAKEVNIVSLDENQLRAAMQMVPRDEKKGEDLDQAKKLISGLQGVIVRNYEFAQSGQYKDSDLDSIRNQMEKMKGWTKIVDSKEENEHSEIFMIMKDDKPMGIAVIDAEPKEISVVVVNGSFNIGHLGKLHGLMGLPNFQKGSVSKKE
jgi:hypothetical protein